MMIRYYELPAAAAGEPPRLLRRLDTGFELWMERLDPVDGVWVDDPTLMHYLAEGAPGAVPIDEARAAELAAEHGGTLAPPPERHVHAPLT